MHLRPAREDDVGACLNVFYTALDDLHARQGEPPSPRNPEALTRVLDHLAATEPRGCWLADDDGRVTAFGMSHQRDDHWYLAFLFVLPEWQGQGVGRGLLEHCLPDPSERPRVRLSVAVEAIQPVSTALYAQYGMVPRVPLYVMTGELRPGALPDPNAGLASQGLEAAAFGSIEDPAAVAAAVDGLDCMVVGYARPQEHRFLAAGDRSGFLYRRGSVTVAYGYVQSSGRIGPICARDPGALPAILGHLVAAVRPVGGWQAIVPGPAGQALLPLLRAGLRLDGPPGVYCASWDGPRFDRYLPMNFALN